MTGVTIQIDTLAYVANTKTTMADVRKRFNQSKRVAQYRLGRLVAMGLVVREKGDHCEVWVYSITPKGRLVLEAFS